MEAVEEEVKVFEIGVLPEVPDVVEDGVNPRPRHWAIEATSS
ncbi:MAG: hypothetical protein ACLR5I_05770 [Odoribacter splanchnicus]